LFLVDCLKIILCCVAFQLVSNAIGFLRSICERPQYKQLFEAEGVLVSICEKVRCVLRLNMSCYFFSTVCLLRRSLFPTLNFDLLTKNSSKIILKNSYVEILKDRVKTICEILKQFLANCFMSASNEISLADVDTRRRAACDLVRGLTKHFEVTVTQIFSEYVRNMLQVMCCLSVFDAYPAHPARII